MAQVWEYIKIALMNIKSNKGRSILTMLGIIIGIASVILIISIGNGMRSQINGELDSMAGGQVALYANDSVEGNDVTFTDEDFELIEEKVEHVKGVTPQYQMWANAEGRKGNFDALVYAGNEALQYCVAKEPMVRGRYFTEGDYLAGNKVKNIGTIESMGTAYPISYDETGIYTASGHAMQRFEVEKSGTLMLAESMNEQFDENGNASYTVKKGNETKTISEEEYYDIFEKYNNASVASFAYGASDAAR